MSSRDLGRLVLPALFRRIEFPGHLGRIGLLGHLGRIKLPAHLRRKKKLPGPWGPPCACTGSVRSSSLPVVFVPWVMHVEGQSGPKGPATSPLVVDRRPVPFAKARGIWHTCRGPGDRSVHVPGRFCAAAAPPFVPWAMHTEGKKWREKKGQLLRL